MKFPLISQIARESHSSIGRSFLTREQRDAQDSLNSQHSEFRSSRNGVCIPFYASEARDLTTGGGTNGTTGHDAIIDLGTSLRDALVLERLGGRVFGGLKNSVTFPKSKAEIAAEWLSETAAAAESTFTFGALNLVPKRLTAFIDVSKKLLAQGEAAEPFIRAELMAALADAIQRVLINGTGASNQPLGILATPGIGAVVGGTDGVAPNYDHVTALEYEVTGTGKAGTRNGWLLSPKVRRKLRRTEMFSGGGAPIWANTEAARLLGHDAGVINAAPDGLTKGSSTGVCSAIIFADFAELIVGIWGAGVFIEANPYGLDSTGLTRITATTYVDGGLRSPEAAAAMTDALAA